MPEGEEILPVPETPEALHIQHAERLKVLETGQEERDRRHAENLDTLRSEIFQRIDTLQGDVSSQIGNLTEKVNATTSLENPPVEVHTDPPEVKVEVPKPETRKVRRGHRKVTRSGK